MKVHIVCKEPDEGHIIHRMAVSLADNTGWSLSMAPRADVDINYFYPYLYYEPCKTMTAACFSHYDEQHPHKAHLWNLVAAKVDLRTTWAAKYANDLQKHGATVVTPPPLDRSIFTLAALPQGEVIGVAGLSYHDNRKGEDLIARLAREFPTQAGGLTWQAIGRGWTIPTRRVENADLPAFYQSLRLFVCASRIEGVPYPPLEALACGVPVIIPRGVGLLDDLPDVPGITRFEAGDYDSLRLAFVEALESMRMGHYDRETLRAATEPYTALAFAEAHEDAFETSVGSRSDDLYVPMLDWQANSGVYYVAFGKPARDCAARALEAWHQHMPTIPAALVSSEPLGKEDTFIAAEDADIGGRIAKISIYDLAPANWQYVLYMDADTEIVAPVPFLFQALADGWELVICKNPSRFHVIREAIRPDNHAECDETFERLGGDELMQLNGGVFGFRRTARVQRFFARWRQEWEQHGKRDQLALLRALYAEPVKTLVLGNEWNTVPRYDDPAKSAGVLHYAMEARRYSGHFNDRLDSPEAWKKVKRWEDEH